MDKKKIVVLTGAGISAESGLKTFRDGDGLWENHSVYEVATPEAWMKNPKLVLEFYAARWEQMHTVQPNKAHLELAALESKCDVHIITQNIDDLHERAGGANILHLHGLITQIKTNENPNIIYELPFSDRYLQLGDCDENGHQLRPHVVWFGEPVPEMGPAMELVNACDGMLIIGTSLQVYPAASLSQILSPEKPIVLLDPGAMEDFNPANPFKAIRKTAVAGIEEAIDVLLEMVG